MIKDRVDRLNKNDGDVRNYKLARYIKFLNDYIMQWSLASSIEYFELLFLFLGKLDNNVLICKAVLFLHLGYFHFRC